MNALGNTVSNLDLLTVAIAVAGMLVLGSISYFSNRKSVTNRVFLALTLSAALWGVVNYAAYQTTLNQNALWILRGVLFLGLWSSFFTYLFTYYFPHPHKKLNGYIKYFVIPVTLLSSTLAFTPLVISNVVDITEGGNIARTVNGVGIFLYAFTSLILNGGALFLLIRNFLKATREEKAVYGTILVGMLVMLTLIILFNFIFPAFLNNSNYVPLGALFLLPFLITTAYSIVKHGIFNIKVAASATLIFALSIVSIFEIIFAPSTFIVVYRTIVFLLILTFGILLLKSVSKEVKQREQIEKLAEDLKKANARLKELDRLKSEFVSIASHQLRSPLTAMKGYASLILEGSFGNVNDAVKEAVQKIFDSSNLMAVSVQDFLDVSRIEQGNMKYNMEKFNLRKLVETVAEELTTVAKEKGLEFNLEVVDGPTYELNADIGKIKQVIYNLVDNSIKYTPKGSIYLKLYQNEENYKIEIKDTGVGIAPEALPKLFAKFVRTRNAHHVNVSGTGLGLFVVKQMVEAHKGKVWATSPGEGKGSTFHIELPISKVS